MRGLLPLVKAIGLSFGITPAHAGLTSFHILPQAYLRDHPRACGAYLLFLFGGLLRWGSPPRMRGLLTDFILQYGALGITPAHAGLTAGGFGDRGYNRDHPRACGAYRRRIWGSWLQQGSPPRMRGLPDYVAFFERMGGITPAHAGLTSKHSAHSVFPGDHPRACGAYYRLRIHEAPEKGSPPRMRGLHWTIDMISATNGITPAHAGLTYFLNCPVDYRRDHPRACGAYRTSVLLQLAKRGSPPRMRGLPVLSRSNQRRGGITPAHAGLTCGSSRYPIFFRDHPRACGAY